MIDGVKELGDIKVDDPVLALTPRPTDSDRIQRRTLPPIAVGIVVEDRLRTRLQLQRNDSLGDPVGHSRHSKDPSPLAVRFRYLHRQHRWGKVTPRRHPVPDLVQVALQIGLEIGDGAPIHPRGTLVGRDSLIRLPHQPLGYGKRLALLN